MEQAAVVPAKPGAGPVTQAEIAPEVKLNEASFSKTLREFARRELNWLGVITGICEPLPLKQR